MNDATARNHLRQEQLLDALVEVMAERGWAGATVARIARRAGLTPGLVHYYFHRKLDLLVGLTSRLRGQLHARLAQQPDTLRGAIDACLALPGDPAAVRCAVVLGAEALRDDDVRHAWSRVLEELRGTLRRHLDGPDADARAAALLGAIVGLWQLGAMGCPPPEGSAADAVWALAAG